MIQLLRIVCLALLFFSVVPSNAQRCRTIHGRAILYSGDSFLEIWHIGTHHTFFVVDGKSTDLILNYIPYKGDDLGRALFADFLICPTVPYRRGASQETIIKEIRHPRVVPRGQ
ncbi:MAG: hypothetical protein ABR987_04480 [Terracidiphilus sp.]|jgi:hypothetical protein